MTREGADRDVWPRANAELPLRATGEAAELELTPLSIREQRREMRRMCSSSSGTEELDSSLSAAQTMESDSLPDPLLELDMVWGGEGTRSGREETGSGVERSRVDCGLGFGPGWGICGVGLGRSDVVAASGPPHIRPTYGLGMGVPVSPDVWVGYRRAVGWRIRDQAVTGLSARTFRGGLRSPVVDALRTPPEANRRRP